MLMKHGSLPFSGIVVSSGKKKYQNQHILKNLFISMMPSLKKNLILILLEQNALGFQKLF